VAITALPQKAQKATHLVDAVIACFSGAGKQLRNLHCSKNRQVRGESLELQFFEPTPHHYGSVTPAALSMAAFEIA